MKNSIIQLFVVGVVLAVLGILATPWWIAAIVAGIASAVSSYFLQDAQESVPAEVQQNDGHMVKTGELISNSASRIAIGGATVSHFLDKLSAMFKQQVASVQEIASRIERIETGNRELIEYAGQAEETIQTSDEKTQKSKCFSMHLMLWASKNLF